MSQPMEERKIMAKAMEDAGYSWALVELYRWQHGELPPPKGSKPLSIPAALRGMAEAFKKPSNEWPTPRNTAEILKFAATLIENPLIQV